MPITIPQKPQPQLKLTGEVNNCALNGAIPTIIDVFQELAQQEVSNKLLENDPRYKAYKQLKDTFCQYYEIENGSWEKFNLCLMPFKNNFYQMQMIFAPVLREFLVNRPNILQTFKKEDAFEHSETTAFIDDDDASYKTQYGALIGKDSEGKGEERYEQLNFHTVVAFYHDLGISVTISGKDEYKNNQQMQQAFSYDRPVTNPINTVHLDYSSVNGHYDTPFTDDAAKQLAEKRQENEKNELLRWEDPNDTPTEAHFCALKVMVKKSADVVNAGFEKFNDDVASQKILQAIDIKAAMKATTVDPSNEQEAEKTMQYKQHVSSLLKGYHSGLFDVPAEKENLTDEELARKLQKEEIESALKEHKNSNTP